MACALIFLNLGLIGVKAQNAMVVKEKVGTLTSFLFTNLKTLTFTATELVVNKTSSSSTNFAYSAIKYFYFGTEVATQVETPKQQGNVISVYPNPVMDQLHIQFMTTKENVAQVKVFDSLGKAVFQQTLDNSGIISVSHLSRGIYFCQLNAGNKLITTKFFKN